MSERAGAKEEILGRIRAALRDAPESSPIPRAYRRTSEETMEARITQFAEMASDYRAHVRLITSSAQLQATIEQACRERSARRIVIPADLPQEWRPKGLELLVDENLPHESLNDVDGVVTACAIVVAQTGTIILDGGFAQGRRAITLIPDYHLCIVFADQIVGLVPEAITELRTARQSTHRPITFISGPSATSDIELSRVEGVHGPRTLEIVIVTEPRTSASI